MLDEDFVSNKIIDKIHEWTHSTWFMFGDILEDIFYTKYNNYSVYDKSKRDVLLTCNYDEAIMIDGIILSENIYIDFNVNSEKFLSLDIYVIENQQKVLRSYSLNILKEYEFIKLFYIEIISKLKIDDDIADKNLFLYFVMFCIRFALKPYGIENLGFYERKLYETNEKMLNL